jgi:arylsulfatase A-like enzyme
MQLGRGPATTDILSLGLAATDYVGHSFGNGGREMCLQMLGLDRELGDFFTLLDSTNADYAVVMTADHGAMDIPERLRDRGIAQAARADPQLAPVDVGKRLGAELKLSGPVLHGEGIGGDVWLDRALAPRDRTRALAAAAAAYRAHPQVAAVFTGAELSKLPVPGGDVARWDLRQRARATYFPGRSGDLIVYLKEYVTPIAKPGRGYVAGHGTPWDYDRRLPIVFWRKGMAASERPDSASTTDIAPTLSALLRLPADGSPSDGRCLERIAGVTCPTR